MRTVVAAGLIPAAQAVMVKSDYAEMLQSTHGGALAEHISCHTTKRPKGGLLGGEATLYVCKEGVHGGKQIIGKYDTLKKASDAVFGAESSWTLDKKKHASGIHYKGWNTGNKELVMSKDDVVKMNIERLEKFMNRLMSTEYVREKQIKFEAEYTKCKQETAMDVESDRSVKSDEVAEVTFERSFEAFLKIVNDPQRPVSVGSSDGMFAGFKKAAAEKLVAASGVLADAAAEVIDATAEKFSEMKPNNQQEQERPSSGRAAPPMPPCNRKLPAAPPPPSRNSDAQFVVEFDESGTPTAFVPPAPMSRPTPPPPPPTVPQQNNVPAPPAMRFQQPPPPPQQNSNPAPPPPPMPPKMEASTFEPQPAQPPPIKMDQPPPPPMKCAQPPQPPPQNNTQPPPPPMPHQQQPPPPPMPPTQNTKPLVQPPPPPPPPTFRN